MRGYEDTKGRDQATLWHDLGRNARKNISNFTNLSPAIEPAEGTRERGREEGKRMEKYWQIAGETRRANAEKRKWWKGRVGWKGRGIDGAWDGKGV